MADDTRKIKIPHTCTVNSRTYFAGEVTLPNKEADAVETFLGTLDGSNVDPLTGLLLPATDTPLKVTDEGEDDATPAKSSRSRRKSSDESDESGEPEA